MGLLWKLLILFFVKTVLCEKVFKSVPVTVKTYENDSVLLPCYVNESGTYVCQLERILCVLSY